MTCEGLSDNSGYRNLLARQQIHDALMRYCWGIDRGYLDLIRSAFHEDARDNHSGVVFTVTRTVFLWLSRMGVGQGT